MKAEYANPFINAAVNVFQQELGVKLSRTDLKKKVSAAPSHPISIIIGVTGPIRGQVVYSMDGNFAYEVAKAMLPGKLPAEIKKLVNSAVSEIANMVTGSASIKLAGESQTIYITPPAVFSGANLEIDFLSITTISIGFLSQIGALEINIALTEM